MYLYLFVLCDEVVVGKPMRNDSLAFAIHLLSPTARERGSEPTITINGLKRGSMLEYSVVRIHFDYICILHLQHRTVQNVLPRRTDIEALNGQFKRVISGNTISKSTVL
jgi:hypothetical protein